MLTPCHVDSRPFPGIPCGPNARPRPTRISRLRGTPRPSPDDRLSPENRRAAIDRFGTEEFDIVVIGGGATGTGSALDAASRGLSVALLEARDYAAGTSSRSSKLIHGGLRYLERRTSAWFARRCASGP